MRKYLRAIAKARMKACGMDRINRRMQKEWRSFIFGDKAVRAERIQIAKRPKRIIRKIEPAAG